MQFWLLAVAPIAAGLVTLGAIVPFIKLQQPNAGAGGQAEGGEVGL